MTADPTPARSVGAGPGRAMVVVVVAVGTAAAFSPASPTGSLVGDVMWSVALAAAVTFGAGRSRPLLLVWLAGVAGVVGLGGGATSSVLGVGGLALALLVVLGPTDTPAGRASAGGLAVLALLWGPSYGFTGLPSLVTAAAVAPVLVEGWRTSGPRVRRTVLWSGAGVLVFVVIASAGAAVAAYRAKSDLLRAANASESALDQLSYDDLTPASDEFTVARDSFAAGDEAMGGLLSLPARLVPVVGQQVQAVEGMATTGRDLAGAAVEMAAVVDYQRLKPGDGTIDLAELESMAGPVRATADAITAAETTAGRIDSPWLVGPVRDKLDKLELRLEENGNAARLAAASVEVAPQMLGADGPKRYLLTFATPAESRPAGGYIGTFAVLEADNGHLSLEGPWSTYDANVDESQRRAFDPPPDWEQRYSSYHVDLFPGNVSASPDWPTDAEVAAQLYEQIPGVGHLDGVLYADPTALADLLTLTGPVQPAGVDEVLSSANLEEFLYYDQYLELPDVDQRRDVLGQVVEATFDALVSRPLPEGTAVFETLGPAVASGHLRLSVFDDQAQAVLDEAGLSGRWDPSPGSDYVSLRSVSLASNKLDYFLHRDVEVDVEVEDDGSFTSVVTVELTNDADPGSLPDYVAGDVQGQYRGVIGDALELFTPLELESVTLDGTEVGVQRQTEFGGNVYGVVTEIFPGQTITVRYRLHGRVDGAYGLDVLPQPLAHADRLTVQVRVPGDDQPTTWYDGDLDGVARLLDPTTGRGDGETPN